MPPTFVNAAPTPVELMTWGMAVAPESRSNQTPVEWASSGPDLREQSTPPPGPMQWRPRRIDLAPGAELARPAAALHQFAVGVPRVGLTEDSAASISRTGADTLLNVSSNPATLYAVTLEPEPAAATPAAESAAPGDQTTGRPAP